MRSGFKRVGLFVWVRITSVVSGGLGQSANFHNDNIWLCSNRKSNFAKTSAVTMLACTAKPTENKMGFKTTKKPTGAVATVGEGGERGNETRLPICCLLFI